MKLIYEIDIQPLTDTEYAQCTVIVNGIVVFAINAKSNRALAIKCLKFAKGCQFGNTTGQWKKAAKAAANNEITKFMTDAIYGS